MSVSQPMEYGVTPGHFKNYPRAVVKVITEAINDHHVTYRLLDGGHIRLYCGDRNVIPIKISASRQEEHTLRHLIPWLTDHVPSWADREREVTEEDLAALAEVKNSQPEPEPEPEPDHEDTSVWEPHITKKGVSYGFETDGETFRCTKCSYTQTSPRGLHFHHAHHTGEQSEWAKSGAEARALSQSQKKAMLQQAVLVLAEAHGVDLDQKSKEIDRLTKENESLVLTVLKLKADLDETRARLSLIKEAMRA